jgi:hypothetical protein
MFHNPWLPIEAEASPRMTGAALLRASDRRHISAQKRKTRGRSDQSNAIRSLADGEAVFQTRENGYAKRESFANVEQGLVKERPLLNETRQVESQIES